MLILGILGILIGVAFFIVFVYRGWSTYWVAPIAAVIVAVFNNLNPVEAVTKTFVGGMVDLIFSLFSIIFLGAILGKIYSDTGAAASIAKTLINRFVIHKQGKSQIKMAVLVLFIAFGLFTMGGIDGYTLTCTAFPICMLVAERLNIPRRFVPAMLCLNVAFMAAPGAPSD